MGKMRSGWDFLPEHGFHGSAQKGMTQVAGYSRAKPNFAKGGKVKGPTDAPTGKSFAKATIPTPQVGKKGPDLNIKAPANHLAFAKGGHFKHEDSEPHESQSGYTHREPEQGEHLEARRGGKVHKASGGPVHNHFRSGHRIESHPNGMGVQHPHHGHPDKHHAPPHKAEGHRLYRAGGGIARPTGQPRAPVLGMKRIRHSPGMPGAGGMGRPQPAIPGMPSQGTASFGQQPMKARGMGSGLGSMAGMKKGGKC